jgi:hypothetical protein
MILEQAAKKHYIIKSLRLTLLLSGVSAALFLAGSLLYNLFHFLYLAAFFKILATIPAAAGILSFILVLWVTHTTQLQSEKNKKEQH